VISLSPYHFLDSSLNFLVFLECLSIVESFIEFSIEHVISYFILSILITLSALCLIFFSSHFFVSNLDLFHLKVKKWKVRISPCIVN
jgi:hypothetical protein